jgi:hypothetical protein
MLLFYILDTPKGDVVSGISVPVDKLTLLAPFIVLASTLVVAMRT